MTTMTTATTTPTLSSVGFLANHRGPYKFLVTRPASKSGFYTSEWLTGTIDSSDVEAEARALLSDPRDAIIDVCVWSVREQQFAGVIRHERS